MSLFSDLMATAAAGPYKYIANMRKCGKDDKPEKRSKLGKCSSTASSLEKLPAEEPKASTSAVAREQNNAGVDQGEKALLEIVLAGFETLNKSS